LAKDLNGTVPLETFIDDSAFPLNGLEKKILFLISLIAQIFHLKK